MFRHFVYFFIAIIIFPLLYTLSLSLRSPETVYSARFFLIPEEFSFQNYVIAFTYNFHGVTFPRMFLNSAIVVTASVSLIIILSIFSAFSFSHLKFPLKETHEINPKNIYGLTKKNNEEIAELFFEGSTTKAVGLRFFTVFGEWGRPDMLIYKYLKLVFDKKSKFYLNNYGNHTRDFTYIKDVVEILFKLFIKKLNKKNIVVNICSNKPIKITKVIKIINKNFKYKPKIFKRSFQKADVKKTHGNNTLIKKISMKNNFSSITKALNNTTKWYQEYWKLFT